MFTSLSSSYIMKTRIFQHQIWSVLPIVQMEKIVASATVEDHWSSYLKQGMIYKVREVNNRHRQWSHIHRVIVKRVIGMIYTFTNNSINGSPPLLLFNSWDCKLGVWVVSCCVAVEDVVLWVDRTCISSLTNISLFVTTALIHTFRAFTPESHPITLGSRITFAKQALPPFIVWMRS